MGRDLEHRVVLAADIDPDTLVTYAANLPSVACRSVDMSDPEARARLVAEARRLGVNAIVGGPPCQGYSTLNNSAESEKYKLLNRLPATFVDMALALGVRFAVMEEVATFMKTPMAAEVYRKFRRAGYAVAIKNLNASHYGVPQGRRRCFVIAIRDCVSDVPTFPKPTTLGDPLSFGAAMAQKPVPPRGPFISAVALAQVKRRESGELARTRPNWYKTVYSVIREDRPSPTITCTPAPSSGEKTRKTRKGSGWEYRQLSPEEGARVQTLDHWGPFAFPRDMPEKKRFKQVGNAVPTRLANIVLSHVLSQDRGSGPLHAADVFCGCGGFSLGFGPQGAGRLMLKIERPTDERRRRR